MLFCYCCSGCVSHLCISWSRTPSRTPHCERYCEWSERISRRVIRLLDEWWSWHHYYAYRCGEHRTFSRANISSHPYSSQTQCLQFCYRGNSNTCKTKSIRLVRVVIVGAIYFRYSIPPTTKKWKRWQKMGFPLFLPSESLVSCKNLINQCIHTGNLAHSIGKCIIINTYVW